MYYQGRANYTLGIIRERWRYQGLRIQDITTKDIASGDLPPFEIIQENCKSAAAPRSVDALLALKREENITPKDLENVLRKIFRNFFIFPKNF